MPSSLDPDLRALQEVRDCVERARAAQKTFARAGQGEVDKVCEAVAQAAAKAAYPLAKLAVEETGIGRVHYKVQKNLFGAEGTWASIRDEKTVGIVSRDERTGVLEVATPIGVVCGIVPTTNPTSTTINNALIALKGRNGIVISPHPRARRCIAETVEVIRGALERAGAPADLVQSLSNPTIESTGALMKHEHVALILATGGSGLVKAAYSSGKPAYGVGPGNVPVYIDRSADLAQAARWIVASQSFDNATLCCSEQALVLDRPIADQLLAQMVKRGAHLCDEEETAKLEQSCNQRGHMCPDIVGMDPYRVAERAGFRVPRQTTVLLAHQQGVGREHPLSIEILCPLLSVHVVDGWEEGCRVSMQILRYGGLGHTVGLWSRDESVLEAWFLEKPASRIVANGPTSQGAVGYSTNLAPAMSLGCGPQAGNITSDNITARHMVNLKRVAFARADWEETYVADHRRASALSGDPAPRGSGLDGDPALGAPRPSAHGSSQTSEPRPSQSADRPHWPGNAPSLRPQPRVAPPQPSTQGTTRMTPKAPRFTAPSAPEAAAPRTRVAPAPPPAPTATAGPYVGMSLTPTEIQGILEHAGRGCPLGPCKGCPHLDVQTNACKA